MQTFSLHRTLKKQMFCLRVISFIIFTLMKYINNLHYTIIPLVNLFSMGATQI